MTEPTGTGPNGAEQEPQENFEENTQENTQQNPQQNAQEDVQATPEPKPQQNSEPKTQAKPQQNQWKKDPEIQSHSIGSFVKNNIWESVSYVVLFAGLILSIFNPFIGGFLVGVILGVYFSQELLNKSTVFKDLVVKEGIFRGFIVIAAVIALLLEAPGLLLGTIIGAWVRPYLGNSISSPFDKQDLDKKDKE